MPKTDESLERLVRERIWDLLKARGITRLDEVEVIDPELETIIKGAG